MLLINESTYLANIVKRNSRLSPSIKIVSTKGFIFDYNVKDNRVEYFVKDRLLYNFLQNFKNKNETIIVATDQDYAGHLIALELLSIFKNENIFRFTLPFESLMGKNIDEEYLLKNSTTKFEYGQAKIYLNSKEFDKEYNKKRIEALSYLASGDTIKSFKLKK